MRVKKRQFFGSTLTLALLAFALLGLIWALSERNRALSWMKTVQRTLSMVDSEGAL